MATNNQISQIETAQLEGVTGGGIGDLYAKAKQKVADTVKKGVDFVRQHPDLIAGPLRLPRRP